MKPVTFHIENKEIQFEVNLMGRETLKIDGHLVSKKWSFPNTKHTFVLDVYGKTEPFYIQTKQAFSTGAITVQLFHNNVLIDEGLIEFDFPLTNHIRSKSNNEMFTTGLIFVVFSMVFGWSKFFLFIGLIILFSSFFEGSNKKETNKESSSIHPDE
ncbi:hypothetical protein WNY78_04360 [Psychroserpens sp. AS72]|uniref:hypothetical protein n=1 Tax=Psychroserpens sp. AS72 TaxID=3135775 RepID=UPI003173A27C